MKKTLIRKSVSNLHRDLQGDCSKLFGDCSGLYGDLDECELTADERKNGVNISELIK